MSFFDEEEAVYIKDLTTILGGQTILNNLSFGIPRNKITTILGFSGAGKSTLLKHILGLLKPTSGSIFVLGDNRSNSIDSRIYGSVNINQIIGRAEYKIYPINEISNINDWK